MAKNKKSKILAMALCASVMTGIYAAPVLAGSDWIASNNAAVGVTDNGEITFTIDGERIGTITKNQYNGLTELTLNGTRIMANDSVLVVGNGQINLQSADAILDAASGIERDAAGRWIQPGEGKTTIEDTLVVDGAIGTISNKDKTFTVDAGGNVLVGDNTYGTKMKADGYYVKSDGNNAASLTANQLTVGGESVITASNGQVNAKVTRVDANDGNGNTAVLKGGGVWVRGADLESSLTTNALKVGGENVVSVNNGVVTTIVDRLEAGNTVVDDRGVFVKANGQNVAQLTENGLNLNDGTANATLTATKLATINNVITDKGEVNSQGDVTSTYYKDGEAGHYSLNTIGDNTAGIERVDYGNGVGETTIEGATTFDQGGMGVYTDTGSSIVGGGNVVITDKNGKFTQIMGGDITAERLNGKVIADLVESSDIANVGGITREAEDGAAPGEGVTTIENGASFDKDGMSIGEWEYTANGIQNGGNTISAGGSGDDAWMTFTSGSNITSFTKNGVSFKNGGTTTVIKGGDITAVKLNDYNIDEMFGYVDDLKDHITVDEKGNVIISADDGSSLTVGNGGTSTGQGGQVTTDGDHNVTGDMNVDGSLTVGDTEGSQTIIEDDKVTTGEISADKGNIGNSHFDENGITVGAAGGQHTTITDTTVDATNGYFDNLQAEKADIGGVGLEGGTVTADKVVTGNTTLDNEGLNVGGQTSVTADGVNVGGNGGTTVSKDGVSIADKTIISDHDVVINEGTADRVSLSETADRVDNLEQGVSELNNRVGELEDRIDKVGAMAAAIANLRTMGYDPAAPTEVAVGIGQYRDETGAALGLFHYPNRDFMLSLSVSTSGDEVMGGIGATWKFGRKSPEKVAEIKKAQAEADARRAEEAKLAKAEEMKQAAKEAKIKAQQERHAKLAAERAAQAEAAK